MPFGNRPTLTLSIGGSAVRLMVSRGYTIEQYYEMAFNPTLMNARGEITDPQRMTEVLSNAYRRLEIQGRIGSVFATYAGYTSNYIIPVPRAVRGDPQPIIHRQLREKIGSAIDAQYIFFGDLHTPNRREPMTPYYVEMVPKKPLTNFWYALIGAGLRPKIVESNYPALIRAVGKDPAIVVNVERDRLDLATMNHNQLTGTTVYVEPGDREDQIRTALENLSNRLNGFEAVQVHLTGGISQEFGYIVQESLQREIVRPEPPTSPFSFPPDFDITTYTTNFGLLRRALRT